MKASQQYCDFLTSKVCMSPVYGLPVDMDDISPVLKPHQRAAVKWAIEGGRAAPTLFDVLTQTA